VKRIILLLVLCSVSACGSPSSPEVVVYVSEDQVFSEPILKDFEKETGIKVRALYDTEEAKSTGVMNRLLTESGNPQADVYWANETVRAELLKQKGVTAPYASPNADGIPSEFKDSGHHWIGFSARARVFVVSRNAAAKPASVRAYADPQWKGKGVLANPLFGTTTTHVSALFVAWGDERAKDFLDKLKRNGTRISTSNGESADLVAAHQGDFALVDSDDAVSGVRQGKPIEMVYPDQGKDEPGCLLLPNAVLLVQGAPHPEQGRKLIDYLLSKETERKLAFADCAQIPLHAGVDTPPELRKIESLKTMTFSTPEVARKLQEIQPILKSWASR
jgi:iron(III) transport system substrate-binding protein